MKNESRLNEIIDKIGKSKDKLLEILIAVQAQSPEHYISEAEINYISEILDIPTSKVYGVASFYAMLSTKKKGKYVIQICNSGPCYVRNSSSIASLIENLLGITVGEITPDGLFSLEYTSCFGACNMAPAIKVNDAVYGNLTPEKTVELIKSIKQEVV